MGALWDERYTPADAAIIKQKARRMLGRSGYGKSDVEDIEQVAAMHLFQKTHLHRPGRGPREKFVCKVVKNKLLNMIEAKTARKRDNRRDVSLDHVDQAVLRDGRSSERAGVQMDVQDALKRMPDGLREIALLRIDLRPSQIEKLPGMTRGKVRWALEQIEQFLHDAGLGQKRDENQQPNGRRSR